MTRILFMSLVLWQLLAGLCPAQESRKDDSLLYRFSLGVAVGPSLSLEDMGEGVGDPYAHFDNTTPHVAVASSVSYRVTSLITVEMAIDLLTLGSQERLEKTQQTYVNATYPGHDIIINGIKEQTIGVAGIGASYGIELGLFRFQPTLLVCLVDADSIRSNLLLKRTGTNHYRGVSHATSKVRTFTVVPVATIRYALGDASSHWGMQLRAAYIHTAFDVEHEITLETLGETPVTARFTARHGFDVVNLQIGLYYNLF